MFSDYLDREKIQNMENEFIKFVLDTSHSDGKQTPKTSGELVLEKSLIETLMSKEKELFMIMIRYILKLKFMIFIC